MAYKPSNRSTSTRAKYRNTKATPDGTNRARASVSKTVPATRAARYGESLRSSVNYKNPDERAGIERTIKVNRKNASGYKPKSARKGTGGSR